MAQITRGLQTLQTVHVARESSGRWLLAPRGFETIGKMSAVLQERENLFCRAIFPGE